MEIDRNIVEKWLKGWSLSRGLPLPVKSGSGFKVEVGWPQQRARYVFPNFDSEFVHLANTIAEPWVFLKVCASPETIKGKIPPRWEIQPPGFMMTCCTRISPGKRALSGGYQLDVQNEMPIILLKIIADQGEVASVGRLIFVEDFVIYDRIETVPEHRRKGLATIVLKELENIALSHGRTNSVLVATQAGRSLYEALGWKLYSPYTSIVIPEQK